MMADLFKEKWVEAFFNKILTLHYHLPSSLWYPSCRLSHIKTHIFPTINIKNNYSSSSSNGIRWYEDGAVNTELLLWGVAGGNAGHGTVLQGRAGWSTVGKSNGQNLPAPALELATATSFQPHFLLCPRHPIATQVPSASVCRNSLSGISLCVCIYIYVCKTLEKNVLQRRGWEMEQSDMWKNIWRTNGICQDIFDWKYYRSLFDITDW